MRILVTGGAGYIGSVLAQMLVDRGHEVRIIDDLSTGHRELVPTGASFTQGRFDCLPIVEQICEWNPESVVHLAASALVSESRIARHRYLENNVWALERFSHLLTMRGPQSLSQFIFASTCSVYGSGRPPFSEEDSTRPENVYARTKLDGEKLLQGHFKGTPVNVSALRFFNVAGADVENSLGEAHFPETHLIPNAFSAAESDSPLKIYGGDYPTPDGTAIRDYVHVKDVAEAIRVVLEEGSDRAFQVLNVGTSNPQSVLQVVSAVEQEIGKTIKTNWESPREGDPPILFAKTAKIRDLYGWSPDHSAIDSIVRTTRIWRQHQRFVEIDSHENSRPT